MAFLKVFTNGEEKTVFLGDDPIVLGRDLNCDVLLKDGKASRRHCVIEPGPKGWQVRDLDSGNGTKVNGQKVQQQRLKPADVVQVGDAKILFDSEGVEVVTAAPGQQERRTAQRRPRSSSGSRAGLVIGAIVLVAGGILLATWKGVGSKDPGVDRAEQESYRVVVDSRDDEDTVRLADIFLSTYPDSQHAAEVRRVASAARKRVETGTTEPSDGYDPTREVSGLHLVEATARLKAMLREVPDNRRPAVRKAYREYADRLRGQQDESFTELEKVFNGLVEDGEYARAREIWFFMHGDPLWIPIPPTFLDRIVIANDSLENAASADRSDLFEQEARAEAAHDFKKALKTLRSALPRFKGTSVARSLEERIESVERALRVGVKGKPTAAPTRIAFDIEKKMTALLKGLDDRDFTGVAAGLRGLAEEARKAKNPGFKEIAARARECEAAAALQGALVQALQGGKVPPGQIDKRWRILAGTAKGLRVRSRGKEIDYKWREAPPDLHLALLDRHTKDVRLGPLGLAVAAHALGVHTAVAAALTEGYADDSLRPALDAFVAARVRSEKAPDGGYVVHAGEIVTRKQYLRLKEEEKIKGLQAEFDSLHAAIVNDKAFSKLKKLTAKKDKLDKAREFALELIFDQKKYFYPYRGTGRMAEYTKVQQEVDARIKPVREIWDNQQIASIKMTPELDRSLKKFDEAQEELEKRLVDVEEKVESVTFLRSYVGQKFTIRTFFRSPEEQDLLRYSDEVMEFNTKVEGDITEVEREQVRVTNDYRIMFGRWPVRLVEPLVLSSRGHCAEMSKIGYFGHFSPTPGRRTPYDRMKLAGYEYGSSENCIMGQTNPMGAHRGWCHSSGHHRNILMPMWTEMGTGHHGRYMTQNYGSAPKYSKHDPEPEDDPYEWEEDGSEESDEIEIGCGPEKPDDDEIDYDDEDDDG